MDYIVTQEQLIKFIPTFLKSRFPEIINVLFEDVKTMSWDDGKTKIIKKIIIIVDNNNILKGGEFKINKDNTNSINNSFHLRRNITNSLKKNLGISIGNQWNIEVYAIEYKQI